MAPTQPQASRSWPHRDPLHSGDAPLSEQAGRSATHLHAHASAASMRPRIASQLSNPPNALPMTSRPQSQIMEEAQPALPSQPPPPRPRSRPPPHVTAEPSALRNPHSRGSSNSASSRSNDPSDEARTRDSEAAGLALPTDIPPPPPIPGSRLPQMTQQASTLSLARTSTPRSVRDLGHDYTRYYNPFATRNNSATDIAAPLPRYHSATGGVVAGAAAAGAAEEPKKRLSNPFDDDKSVSSSNLLEVKAAAAVPVKRMSAQTHGDSEKSASFFPIYLDDRLGAPGAENQGYNFPLYWDEKEEDDDMHMPMVDDDKRMAPTWKQHFSRDSVFSTLGLIFMILGLLTLFVLLPVLSAQGIEIIAYTYNTPLDQMWAPGDEPPVTWATVNPNRTWPLLKNLRSGLIDSDTPQDAYNRTALDGSVYKLVFSDEFSEPNRTFYQGDDPYWFAPDIWYGATQDLEWYDPDAATTWEGALELRLDAFPNHGLQFRSGMLNSWNQLCFKGGIFEVSVSLPGPGGVHGLWPGVWSMGNLGRPGYLATTEGLWPYTYNECDVGITPNQSSADGINKLPGQRLTSCGCQGEDHPTPGTGRGAPEIDIIEVSGDWGGMGVAVATQSFQVAPFDVWWYPDYEFMETPDYSTSFVNTYTGGPFQQAVSTTTMLNNSWYDGLMYQKYAYEYTPGSHSNSSIAWWVGDQMTMRFDSRALRPNGNIGQRLISEEPMSLVLNLGISNAWVDINWAALKFPTVMRIDYVRWYQKEGEEMVTCDPPGYETTEYIKKHPEAYNNPNYTHWKDIPGYTWPQNTFMNDCKA